MTNKLDTIKKTGFIIAGKADIFTHAPDVASYNYAPQFDAVKQYRIASKQGIIIGLALRNCGASIDAIYAAGGISVASAYSYLSRDFAGKKGLGVYTLYMSRREYLARVTAACGETVANIEARHFSADCALGLESALDAGCVVLHAWHNVDTAHVGRAPVPADYIAGSVAAACALGTIAVLPATLTVSQQQAAHALLTHAPVVKASKSAVKLAKAKERKASRASIKTS